jgi:Protein of unknown function (DUF2997)
MSRIIEVTVSPKGEVTVQTKGYAGGSCLQSSKFLEDSLRVVSNDKKTSEFFSTEEVRQQVQQ